MTYEDLYVLTLPGFRWTKIDAKYGGRRRGGQACLAANNRQMISIGGTDMQEAGRSEWTGRDPFPQGLGVFDMTALEWRDNYDHQDRPYDSPKHVQDWYADG